MNDLINTGNLIQKFLPKQADIDKILKVIQRKVLKDTHLLVEIKEIQAGYLNSPHFKDIYLYLAKNKLPTSKAAIRKVKTLAERHILWDSLLFKITPEKETAVLAVSETCTNKIITLYHSSLFAGHQSVIKTCVTISDKFFIPNLIHYLRSCIKGVIYVTHMKIQEFQVNSGDCGGIYELGQYDLLYTYGAIAQAWYIL